MKKVVLKLDFADEKTKQKAMRKVSGLSGLESIALDQKDRKLTLTGDIDAVAVVAKLRKLCRTEIITVGPAKEEAKKDTQKKDEPKKGDTKKGDDKKKDAPKDDSVKAYPHPYYYQFYQHAPLPPPPYYAARSVEEDPNGCVIC